MIKEAYKLFLGTLSNENRLKIINLLRESSKNVSEICRELRFNQTTVSHNLRRLEKCGFVFMKRKGKCRYYSLNERTIKPLMKLIDQHMHKYCEKIIEGKR